MPGSGRLVDYAYEKQIHEIENAIKSAADAIDGKDFKTANIDLIHIVDEFKSLHEHMQDIINAGGLDDKQSRQLYEIRGKISDVYTVFADFRPYSYQVFGLANFGQIGDQITDVMQKDKEIKSEQRLSYNKIPEELDTRINKEENKKYKSPPPKIEQKKGETAYNQVSRNLSESFNASAKSQSSIFTRMMDSMPNSFLNTPEFETLNSDIVRQLTTLEKNIDEPKLKAIVISTIEEIKKIQLLEDPASTLLRVECELNKIRAADNISAHAETNDVLQQITNKTINESMLYKSLTDDNKTTYIDKIAIDLFDRRKEAENAQLKETQNKVINETSSQTPQTPTDVDTSNNVTSDSESTPVTSTTTTSDTATSTVLDEKNTSNQDTQPVNSSLDTNTASLDKNLNSSEKQEPNNAEHQTPSEQNTDNNKNADTLKSQRPVRAQPRRSSLAENKNDRLDATSLTTDIKLNEYGGTLIIPDDTVNTSNAILTLIELNSKAPDQNDTKSILDITQLISTIAQKIEEKSENSGKLSDIGSPNQASTSAPVKPEHTLYYNNLSEGKHVFSVAEKTSSGPILKIYFDEKKPLTLSEYDNWAKTEVERFRTLNGDGKIVISGELPLGFVKAAIDYCAINNIDCVNNTNHTIDAPKVADLDSIKNRFEEKSESTTKLANQTVVTEAPILQNTESSTLTAPKVENKTPENTTTENTSPSQKKPDERRTNIRQRDPLYFRPPSATMKLQNSSPNKPSSQPLTTSSTNESQATHTQETPTTHTSTTEQPTPTDTQKTTETPPLDTASTNAQESKLSMFKEVLDRSNNNCLDLFLAAKPEDVTKIQTAMAIIAEARNWTIDNPNVSNTEIEERFAKIRPLCEFLNKAQQRLSSAPQETQQSQVAKYRSQVTQTSHTGFDGLNCLIDKAISVCHEIQFFALLENNNQLLQAAQQKENALQEIRNKNEIELPGKMDLGKERVKEVINMKNEVLAKQNAIQTEKTEKKANLDSPNHKMHH